jgi:GGDEF domain-containing protein
VARAGELAGAAGPEASALAVDALHAVIWSAVREELSDPDPGYVLALAERLTLVSDVMRGAVLRSGEEAAAGGSGGDRGPLRVAPEPPEPEPGPGPPPELRDTSSAPRVSRGGGNRPALWMGAVEDEIARAELTGTPLSVLVVELDEADRLAAVHPALDARATFGRFAQAVRSVMRRHDVLACETDSRAWIIARDTGRAGARALGSRVARAVRASDAWAGAPLTVSIGVAVLGEEGRAASELIGAAEEAKFAAAASGVGITGDPDDSPLAG